MLTREPTNMLTHARRGRSATRQAGQYFAIYCESSNVNGALRDVLMLEFGIFVLDRCGPLRSLATPLVATHSRCSTCLTH
jgi:hypothetical protein